MPDAAQPAESISITVCGDGGTGKSSLSLRLVHSAWTTDYDPTVQDSYSVTREYRGRTYHLHLTDTAGQEEYRGLWAAQQLCSDGYLLVYDITSAHSLKALDYFNGLIELESEERMCQPGAVPHVKVVAGNKCDLEAKREVAGEGRAWAERNDAGWLETSAKEEVNVEEAFEMLIARVVEARRVARGEPLDGMEGIESEWDEKNEGAAAVETKKERWWRGACCSVM